MTTFSGKSDVIFKTKYIRSHRKLKKINFDEQKPRSTQIKLK